MKYVLRLSALLLLLFHWVMPLVMAQESGQGDVLVIEFDGPVTPIMHSYIERAIEEADIRNNEALIIRLNTPGGSVDLTNRIIQTIFAADVPVVVYVWPPGGMAASAGTFITLAGHAAAMAPNTTIGAASPIDGSGGEIDETLREKIENMLVAEIRNLADRRGEEALEWAEEAITEAKAATANEALDLGIIDFIADDVDDLLAQLDGFTVTVRGDEVTLETADAEIEFLEQTAIENFLNVIANPSIALLLISIGSLALVYELINPGGYISGIIGVILLLVGFFAIGQLPVNYAGLGLILLAFVLFGAELFTPTYGALTATGVASFIIGGLILFNTGELGYQVPLPTIISTAVTMAAAIGIGMRYAIKTMRRQPVTGEEGLLGATGVVKSELKPGGIIMVWGERWQAASSDGEPIPAGTKVKITKIDGFQLTVERIDD